jgi:acyl carrier protein
MTERTDVASVERVLERFIVDELLEEGYDGRDPLATSAVDSLGIEQLIEYVKEEFGVRVEDQDLAEEHFASLAALAAFVDSRLEAAGR